MLVLGLLLGLGGGAFAVAWVGRDDSHDELPATDAVASAGTASGSGTASVGSGTGSASGSGSTSTGSGSAEPGSGSAEPGGSAKPATVKLVIDSSPHGASVFTADGKLLGMTKLELEWPPAAEPVTFELRMTGFKKKTKQLVVSDAMTVAVDLERAVVPGRGSARGSAAKGSDAPKPGSGTGGTGLIRPGD